MSHRAIKFKAVVALTILMAAANAFGQTSAFTYQGKLSDNGSPANGAFDLQFKLFDNATVGSGSQQETVKLPPFPDLEIPLGRIWFPKRKRNGNR